MRFLLGGSIALYGLYFLFIARQAEMTRYKVFCLSSHSLYSSHYQEERASSPAS